MNTSKQEKKSLQLSTPLRFLKGIGPARAAYFQRKDIISVQDALFYFPRRYEDRTRLYSPGELAQVPEGTQVSIKAQIQSSREIPLKNRRKLFEVRAMGSDGHPLLCSWFHVYKGMKEKFRAGQWAVFTGPLKKFRSQPQIVHPDVEPISAEPTLPAGTSSEKKSLHWGRIVPIYSRTEGLSQKLIREVIHQCMEEGIPLVEDILPNYLREKYSLPHIHETLTTIHFPKKLPLQGEHLRTEDLPIIVQRLIFEEFFKFQLILLMDRTGMQAEPGIALRIKNHMAQVMRKNMPYTLTNAQERSIAEVLEDLQKDTAMNRIIQGDVGSGKTNVAFICLAEAAENGFQGALMVPTEILAEQHFQSAQKLFANTGIEVGLLTGSLSRAEKIAAQEKIASGAWQVVIGTHALIQEAVSWKNLAFAVIDEQHRFGVRQRTFLKEKAPKGKFPHVLTMTATPIPRSLALTVFGELDVSTIDELPPGRQPIVSKVLKGSERDRLYKLILREVDLGRQAYLVYPLVNDSEKEGMEKLKSVESEFQRLKTGPLAKLRLAMVHGQMRSDERASLMRAFKNHEYDVLIATTVIEVGVDVPNATVMAIENAERFGLSQLHQLRGRVGRGAHKSFCVMITDARPLGVGGSSDENSEEGVEESPWTRLLIMEESQNGFYIAEKDLKLRGPGDFFGTKQSGSPTFQLADLSRDAALLEKARNDALAVYARDPDLKLPEHTGLKKYFQTVIDEAALTLKSG